MDDQKLNDFLANIGQIESSGGKNTNHPTVTSGIQAGDHAIGTYGLMPNTIDEIAASSSDPQVRGLTDMDNDEKQTYLMSHPEMQDTLAKSLATKVLSNQNGDEQKAAYAWNHGSNLSADQVDQRGYQDSDYVKKYNKVAGLIAPQRTTASTPLSMEGTPAGNQVISALGGDPNIATAGGPTPMMMPSGSMGGFGGGSLAKSTLDHNADQRADIDSALKGLAENRGAASMGIDGRTKLYSSMNPTRAPASDEDDQPTNPVGRPASTLNQFTPVKTPDFNAITRLIADYKARTGGK